MPPDVRPPTSPCLTLAGINGQVLESLQGHALGVLGWRSASGPVPQRTRE